jgi:hypothetical protein
MAFAVARTRDEAHLYLELHPCPDCGAADAPWEQALVEVDGEIASSYAAICPGCSAEREYLFGVPARQTAVEEWPAFGGSEPSEILDAGQWLAVADTAAASVPTDPVEADRVLAIAQAAVAEVIKFVPAGADAVPDDEFWTPQGQAVLAAEPARFRLDRLLLTRDTYARLRRDIDRTGAR